ncbi:MAG: hypothetical protein JKY84_13605 [Emcibacteraceae bacterium]|nr:hypothetical protein [Emcibacteraceae bacterium]
MPEGVEARAIHSAYFQMIAEHGYVGFLVFCAFLYYLFNTARRMARQCRELPDIVWFSDLTIAIRSSIAAYMIIGFTTNIAFFDLIYFIVVVTAIADNILQRERDAFQKELDSRLAVTT